MNTIATLTLVALAISYAEADCQNIACNTGYTGATCCHSPNYSSRGSGKVEIIVLHYTAGTDSGSLSWLTNPSSGVSAHYLVQTNGKIYQLVDESYKSWHAGTSRWGKRTDINPYSIGIEISNDGKGTPYTSAQYTALTNLIKDLKRRYSVPIEILLAIPILLQVENLTQATTSSGILCSTMALDIG